MLREGRIQVGAGPAGPIDLLPSMANRHGLIAGATGTGKTVSLKVLAEGFSDLGVSVFLSDIKSDLSGMVLPGAGGDSIFRRLDQCGIPRESFAFHAYPTVFWDVYGEQGHPIRATVRDMGPLLMSRMLSLNETQAGVMNIAYRVSNDEDYPLENLRDLSALLIHMGERAKEYTLRYGNVASATVGAIQRAVAILEDQGGSVFFGEPAIDILDWLTVEESTGRGRINILSADRLFNNPTMYSTFLLWMLTRLYDLLPERGDGEKPLVVFFFDEAHLLFNNCGRALMEKIEQVVRLIRSKGVGVYFITQNPTDIPMTVLGQLGNRIQHALRAYTPLDQKAVKVAAQTFRTNPSFDTEEAITTLKTGEALISFLDEHGAPGVVERATILPPQSYLGAISPEVRARTVAESPFRGKYDEAVNGYGAYEKLHPPKIIIMQPTAQPAIPPTTPLTAQVSTVQTNMAQTFKVFDPVSGQYVEKEIPTMTQPQQVSQPAQPVMGQPVYQQPQPVYQAAQQVYQAQPVYQPAPQPVYQQAQPVYQAAQESQPVAQEAQPVYQAPVYPDPQAAVQPVYQPAQPVVQAPQQTVPVIQVQPRTQQMPVLVLDPATGQYVQQMMDMVLDAATGNYVPAPVAADPKALAEQQKAAEKAAKEAAKAAREQEAAERRARNDALREEAAERARRNDSVAGRVKNTAISTATRQVVTKLTNGIGKAIEDMIGGGKK